MFIKLEEAGSGEKVIVAGDQIAAVVSSDGGKGATTIVLVNGQEIVTEENFQVVKNRLAKIGDVV